jgi:gamma-glutamyltranspeptidase
VSGGKAELLVENRMDQGIVSGLRDRGHRVAEAGPWMAGWGPVSMIESDDVSARGVADPRVSTSDAATR